MKKLYKMLATKEGIPKTSKSHQYNTARLFTPRAECQKSIKGEVKGDAYLQDLFYNLDRVTFLEQLLKSILLYSIDKSVLLPVLCVCHLLVQEQEIFTKRMCSNATHSFSFPLKFDHRSRRKWIEIDVTSFLQPLISFHKKNIHITANITCVTGDYQGSSTKEQILSNLDLMPPSLLLYLNDTSEQAYHRWNSVKSNYGLFYQRKRQFRYENKGSKEHLHGTKRSSSRRRGQGSKRFKRDSSAETSFNLTEYFHKFHFPENECELHDFRLTFSQLNWDHWIVAPHRYNPRYCKGECPRAIGHRYGSPVHSMVQNIIYEKLDSSIPRPSCVPSVYNPLSVLIIETDGSIVYKEYEDMIATKCTCR
ncbi:growth/differentiation factor 9 [Latimeria chalumnae]|uniref:growth/differentiation factor 9 n=1 Tax=Latimeria chalumnae TaxID=7897 RepID=UPI0006D8F213|nr:PREDICTED: growth/differentiation factor 9 [Latimeria chalumnae]|eukprot:XP_006003279.2 PREDICTED: growth/differentiation factor 9 [Latimeria chalumnae]